MSTQPNLRWDVDTDAPYLEAGVVILTAQRLSRRTATMEVWDRYNDKDLLVIDEAHHAAAKSWERSMDQWSGRVLGMTATPWRLSKKEGFDHLFDTLITGPQIANLQSSNDLSTAKVLMPPPEDRILGGDPDWDSDYNESSIARANFDRPEVMTARALNFWQEHAENRQTIVYAVSVGHADNLVRLFKDANISAEIVLGVASPREQAHRSSAIDAFRDGRIKVLVNVIVATEGFDLPDASCILLTRPTLSLSLFMQMVGRGLRPKGDGGNCLILDLAGNTTRHGLPEKNRKWSLEPRGSQLSGEAPTVWCAKCSGVSHAASHNCEHCENPLGEDCKRCHRWRALNRWQYKEKCGDTHDLVCDFCHNDAHERAYLPSIPTLYELVPYQYNGESEQPVTANDKIDLDLADPMRDLFGKFLDRELRRAIEFDEDCREELRGRIRGREHMLNSNEVLNREFNKHYWKLKEENRPEGEDELTQAFHDWLANLRNELAIWKKDLEEWNSLGVDKHTVYQATRYKMGRFLSLVAQEENFLPKDTSLVIPVTVDGTWHLISSSTDGTTNFIPRSLRTPDGFEIHVDSWKEILIRAAEWLIRRNRLPMELVPVRSGGKRYVLHSLPEHPDGKAFKDQKKLSNGLYLEIPAGSRAVCRSVELLNRVSPPHEQFYVQYQPYVSFGRRKQRCKHHNPEMCKHPRQ